MNILKYIGIVLTLGSIIAKTEPVVGSNPLSDLQGIEIKIVTPTIANAVYMLEKIISDNNMFENIFKQERIYAIFFDATKHKIDFYTETELKTITKHYYIAGTSDYYTHHDLLINAFPAGKQHLLKDALNNYKQSLDSKNEERIQTSKDLIRTLIDQLKKEYL